MSQDNFFAQIGVEPPGPVDSPPPTRRDRKRRTKERKRRRRRRRIVTTLIVQQASGRGKFFGSMIHPERAHTRTFFVLACGVVATR